MRTLFAIIRKSDSRVSLFLEENHRVLSRWTVKDGAALVRAWQANLFELASQGLDSGLEQERARIKAQPGYGELLFTILQANVEADRLARTCNAWGSINRREGPKLWRQAFDAFNLSHEDFWLEHSQDGERSLHWKQKSRIAAWYGEDPPQWVRAMLPELFIFA